MAPWEYTTRKGVIMREFIRRLKPAAKSVCGWVWGLLRYDPHEPQWEMLLACLFVTAWGGVALGAIGIAFKVGVPLTAYSMYACAGFALVVLAPLAFEWIKFTKRVQAGLVVLDVELMVYAIFICAGEVRLVWPDFH